jgi:hypothetical protein
MPEKNNGVEKNCVANQVVLKSKELASLTLTCLTLTDFHEVSRATQALEDSYERGTGEPRGWIVEGLDTEFDR